VAKTSLTPFEQKRKSLLADMTPACRTVAKEFEEKIKIGNQGVILIRYDIGAKVCRVVEKEAQYGSNAVKQLAAYLGFKDDGSALYSLKNFATAFTRSFVKGQVSKPLLNGRAMELGHFLQIMKVKSKKQQHVLFDKVRAECLTCNELEKEIQANYQTKNKRTSGRKPQKPKSPGAGLQKLFSQAKQLANYADITDESIFNPLLKIAATDVNDQLVERFVDAKKEVSRAQGELAGVLREAFASGLPTVVQVSYAAEELLPFKPRSLLMAKELGLEVTDTRTASRIFRQLLNER